MRRFLIVLLLIGVFYVLSALNKKRLQNRFPFLKRIDASLTIVAYALLAVYGLAFFYWLYTMIFKK